MLRDCSLETELANMKCKTDPLEEGGVGVDNNFIIITTLIVVVTISIIKILILPILQTIHVCDCQGDLCNKDFASAGDNGGGGGDKSVMVGRFTKVAIVMIVVALVDFLFVFLHEWSLHVNSVSHLLDNGFTSSATPARPCLGQRVPARRQNQANRPSVNPLIMDVPS